LPEIEATTADIERVLERGPIAGTAGVGAPHLGECIALQLRQTLDTPARDIAVRVSLKPGLVAGSNWYGSQAAALQRKRFGDGVGAVRSCHPRPGRRSTPAQAEYVIPDVVCAPHRARWIVEIIKRRCRRVNNAYANLISRSPDHAMLRNSIAGARWLMRRLEFATRP